MLEVIIFVAAVIVIIAVFFSLGFELKRREAEQLEKYFRRG